MVSATDQQLGIQIRKELQFILGSMLLSILWVLLTMFKLLTQCETCTMTYVDNILNLIYTVYNKKGHKLTECHLKSIKNRWSMLHVRCVLLNSSF